MQLALMVQLVISVPRSNVTLRPQSKWSKAVCYLHIFLVGCPEALDGQYGKLDVGWDLNILQEHSFSGSRNSSCVLCITTVLNPEIEVYIKYKTDLCRVPPPP